MTHLEHQVYSKVDSDAKMASVWKRCAETAGPNVAFMGLTIDYLRNGAEQVPTVYVLLTTCDDSPAEEERLRPLVDAAIADARARYESLRTEDLYSSRDAAIWNFESAERFAIKLFTAEGLRRIREFEAAEKIRRSPGKNVAPRYPREVAGIEDYSVEEFHIFYHTEAIQRASDANGLSDRIAEELIAYCHQVGRSDRTRANTRFVFSSDEELKRDYLRFYK